MGAMPLQVSSDDRTPIERLGRKALEKIADFHSIQYPVGLPKYVWDKGIISGGLLMLIKSHNIDVTQSGVDWEGFQQVDESNRPSHVESYPVKELHQTARDQTDSNSELLRRLDVLKDKDDEILDLKAQNEKLRTELDTRLSALEDTQNEKSAPDSFPIEKLLPWQLRHMAKDRGIETKGRSDDEIRRDLTNGKDTP